MPIGELEGLAKKFEIYTVAYEDARWKVEDIIDDKKEKLEKVI
jgi:hypothetical protein